jgi:hypothetical protein
MLASLVAGQLGQIKEHSSQPVALAAGLTQGGFVLTG